MNEFRRLINRKVVIGFIALLVINVSLYVYQQTKGAGLKELRFETVQRQRCVDYYGDYDIEAAINAVNSDIEGILSYRKADKQGTVVESEVQADAAKKAAEDVGKVEEVLVEEINDHDATLVTGRTSKNYLVHFKGDKSLIGSIVDVKLCESKGFYYIGELA